MIGQSNSTGTSQSLSFWRAPQLLHINHQIKATEHVQLEFINAGFMALLSKY
jgi:hypothetical protein